MRVLVVDPSSFTLPYDHCLCQGLSQAGCEVALACSQFVYGEWNQEGDYERWEHFYRLTNRLYRGRPSGALRSAVKAVEHGLDTARFVRALDAWRPDVVHYQWLPLPVIDRPALAVMGRRYPLVFTLHNTNAFHGTGKGIQARGFQQACRQFDHLIAHTEYTRGEAVSRMGLDPSIVGVIPHGVFDYYRQSLSYGTSLEIGMLEVLFFGVLKEYKGLDLLIRAFASLPETVRRRTRLRVAGYPSVSAQPYQLLAHELGIAESVVWDLRFVPESEVASVFVRATIVCLPYKDVDQSGVLLTALAFAKPIVASRIGGFPETIQDGVHGYLVQPGSVSELAAALGRVLEDEGLRQRMGESVRRLADTTLSWREIGRATADLYDRMVAGSKKLDESS